MPNRGTAETTILLVIALFGLIVPNGLFLYWLFYEYDGLEKVAQNKLALAFIIDALLATGLLALSFCQPTDWQDQVVLVRLSLSCRRAGF